MKNILVTGAGGGMGAAICRALTNSGYRVFGIDKRLSGDDDLPYKLFACDVTDESAILGVRDAIADEVGELFAVVHTAGIYDLDSLVEIDERRFMRIFDINLFGVYRINKAFLPLMKAGSRIVITTSELAPLDPLPFTGLYAITKSALEKYAASLRMELTLLGISVSIIRPGATETSLLGDSTTALDKFTRTTALYPVNAEKFKKIVDSVESKKIPSERIGRLALKAISAKTPRLVYNINRNPLLLILNALPDRLQIFIISKILKNKKSEKRTLK